MSKPQICSSRYLFTLKCVNYERDASERCQKRTKNSCILISILVKIYFNKSPQITNRHKTTLCTIYKCTNHLNIFMNHLIESRNLYACQKDIQNLVQGLAMRRTSHLKSNIVSNHVHSCVNTEQTTNYCYFP